MSLLYDTSPISYSISVSDVTFSAWHNDLLLLLGVDIVLNAPSIVHVQLFSAPLQMNAPQFQKKER
jgi:hypothetical protein